MSQFNADELVQQLASENGWNRDMAQQLLVQRASPTTPWFDIPGIWEKPLGQLHALWTLEGLEQLDLDVLYDLLSDRDANIRASVTAYASISPWKP